ncbi:MAG: hypothetical protein ABJF60_18715 [Roseobacter sp.]
MTANLSLSKSGGIVTLKRLSSENAEIVLSWRNSDKVRANSLDERKIQLSDHLEFIENSHEKKRHYFVVEIHNEPQGLFNVNEIGDATGLWGCYLSSTNTIRPGVFPLMVGLSGKLAFEELQLQNLRSEVLAQNIAPQKLNDYLGVTRAGFRKEKRRSANCVDVICYDLSKSDWDDILVKIDKLLPSRIREGLNAVKFPT